MVEPAPSPPRLDPPPGARVHLLVLVLVLGAWWLPFTDVQRPDGAVVTLRGIERGGAVAALGLLAAWGWGLTTLLARTRRHLRLGSAFTEAALAGAFTALLLLEHPWVGGVAAREAWLPVFAPLAALALLEALLRTGRMDPGAALGAIRGASALFAAGALAVHEAWLPAATAGAVAAAPLLLLRLARPEAGRGALLGLRLAASLVLLLVGVLDRPVGGGASGELILFGRYVWIVAAGLLVLVDLRDLVRAARRA